MVLENSSLLKASEAPQNLISKLHPDGISHQIIDVSIHFPGLAFLPHSSTQSAEITADDFAWRKVTVEWYSEKSNKWRIKEIKSAAIYDVPRVYLMFTVEKPLNFARKLHGAIQLRSECEQRLKFEAMVDGIALSEIPKPSQPVQDKIRRLLSQPSDERRIEALEREHVVGYQKTLAGLELMKSYEIDPRSFLPTTIQLPTMAAHWGKLKTPGNNGTKTFEKSRREFLQLWLYCRPEAIKIMESINNACEDVAQTSLFWIDPADICSLMGFVAGNNKMLSTLSNFLHERWAEAVVQTVKFHLAHIGKGWFDLDVKDWGIFRMSKLHRLIELIKHRMEIAVRLMLRSSLQAFVNHLCRPCESMLDVAVDFVWGNDLVASWFPWPQPVFSLQLSLVDGEPSYSTNIGDFEMEIIRIVKEGILTTHEVPHIDGLLVRKLKFDRKLRLSSVGLYDEEIQRHIFHLRQCYHACQAPLHAYGNEYRRFAEFLKLSIPEFVISVRDAEKSPKEMKELIADQSKSIDEIELTVPSRITIGAFEINVSALKTDLVVKRRDLRERLVTMYKSKVKGKLETINMEYEKIFAKLTMKCETIEDIVGVREWIPRIPEEVSVVEGGMKKLSGDFDVLESLLVVLSDDMFQLKVSSLRMPRKIREAIVDTELTHKTDFEMFRKLQLLQETQFMDKIEVLEGEVEVNSKKHRFDELSSVAIKIEVLWRNLTEMRALGEVLNNRQAIFNQPEIDMERLNVSVERLHPHHTLWTTALNFLKSKDAWTSTALSSLDTSVIETEIERCENVLQASRCHFASDAEMMELIGKISDDVSNFKKHFDVLRDLKNPNFEEQHWLSLSDKTGIVIEPTLDFNALVAGGILERADVVREISAGATREAEETRRAAEEEERKRREHEEMMKEKKARRPRKEI